MNGKEKTKIQDMRISKDDDSWRQSTYDLVWILYIYKLYSTIFNMHLHH